MPPERARQFDVIEKASAQTLRWAARESVALVRIEPVVPFVETDFSLHAWLFFETDGHVQSYRTDGTAERVESQFRSYLTESGYPNEWLSLVDCHFSSKETVDRDYEGSYFYFLR